MKNNLIEIFIGSDIEANYIASLLIDNHIKYFIQNTLEESAAAGWASGSSYNSSIISVEIEDFDKAKKIIDEYKSN